MSRAVRQGVVGLMGLTVGVAVAGVLWVNREVPTPQVHGEAEPMVEVVQAERVDAPIRVTGRGTVRARARIGVVPQVSGRVVEVHPELSEGGLVPGGEAAVQIETDDYELARRRAEARLARLRAAEVSAVARVREAEANLEDAREEKYRVEQLEADGAAHHRELRRARLAYDIAGAQLEAIEADRDATESELVEAEAALEQAELDLGRTRLAFDEDVIVSAIDVEEGQHVTAGERIGQVYRIDAVEIVVPMEQQKLRHLSALPVARGSATPTEADAEPTRATVGYRFAGQQGERTGRVVRVGGEVDARSRMLNVVVQVDDPRDAEGGPPLVPGTFATVTFEGPTLEDVVRVPADAVQNRQSVWLVNNGALRRAEVEIIHTDADWAYLAAADLEGGEQVVHAPLSVQTEGMRVRTRSVETTRLAEQEQQEPEQASGDDAAGEPLIDEPASPGPALDRVVGVEVDTEVEPR